MKRQRRGITLFEVLLAITLVSTLAGFGLRAFTLSSRVSAYNELGGVRLEQIRRFDRDLREVIQSATGLAESAADYTRDDDTLVLELPARGDEPRRAVVSRVPESGVPFVLVMTRTGGAWEMERFQSYPHPLSTLLFNDERPELIGCRYRLARQPGEREPDYAPVHELFVHPRALSWEQTR